MKTCEVCNKAIDTDNTNWIETIVYNGKTPHKKHTYHYDCLQKKKKQKFELLKNNLKNMGERINESLTKII